MTYNQEISIFPLGLKSPYMFICHIRTLYGHPKGAMDTSFGVGNHFLSVAKYFIPLINILKKVKKLILRGIREESVFVYISFGGICLEMTYFQKLFKGISY